MSPFSLRPPAAPLPTDRGGQPTHFAALPGTQGEISLVDGMYRRDLHADLPATFLVRDRATKQAFLADAPRHCYVHVATHGYFLPAEFRSGLAVEASRGLAAAPGVEAQDWPPGLLSGLALAGANHAAGPPPARLAAPSDAEDNGILTAEEIAAMNLEGTELVVLSACDTGLGAVAGGEGLLGLQRAFQAAGARDVLASLWRIDDRATQTLMGEFYRNLWEKKLGKLDALRQAQLSMLRQYDPQEGQLRGPGAVRPVDPAKLAAAREARGQPLSPFYWGSFVLSGDWK